MWTRAYREQPAEAERVLLIAPRADEGQQLATAFGQLGADVQHCTDVAMALATARQQTHAAIILMGRDDAGATALMLTLLGAEARGTRLLLVVTPDQAENLGGAMFLADEVLLSTLASQRIAAASGVGLLRAEPCRLAG